MNLRRILARNASGNLLRGISGAALAIGLPPFLTRTMPVVEFSAWALILQLAAYVNYLDVGVQIALARLIAHTHERKEFDLRNEIVSTGVAILAISALVALLIAAILTWQLPRIYPSIPKLLLPQVRMGLIFVAGSLGLSLPSSGYTGVLIGLNRNHSSGIIAAGTRLGGGAAIVILARTGAPLSLLAASLGTFYILNAGLQMLAAHRHCPGLKVSPELLSWSRTKILAADCGYISSWNLGMFFVSGLDVVLVGRFAFTDLGAYAVASTLVLFISGVSGSLFSSMLAPIATLHAQGELGKISRFVLKSTRIGIFVNTLICLPLIFAGRIILAHWVTPDYARTAWPILLVLVIANFIRLIGNPYSVAVLATGQQKIVVMGPIIEGTVNLTFSIFLGLRMGAMGVALGTLIGSIVGILAAIFIFIPRTNAILVTRREFALNGIFSALMAISPAVFGLWFLVSRGPEMITLWIASCGVVLSTIFCARNIRAA